MREKLLQMAADLDAVERLGAAEDVPEGSRYVMMSDTLAKRLATVLREQATYPDPDMDQQNYDTIPGYAQMVAIRKEKQ